MPNTGRRRPLRVAFNQMSIHFASKGVLNTLKNLMSNRSVCSASLLLLFAASLILALGQSASAHGQDFTTRAVRIIVTGPGGSSDTLSRVLAAELTKVWKNPVIVENKSGVGGLIGTTTVEKAPPDGHTLLINTSAFIVSSETRRTPPYDPIGGFTPIALLGKGPFLLVARSSLPQNTLPELFDEARRKPDSFTYGSTGIGGITHLSAELLFLEAGVKMRHIPFRNGNQAVADLAGGQIDLYLGSISASLPLVHSGRLKALAVTSLKPSSFVPGVPTVADAALKNFSLELWWGLLAPANTPKPIVDEINRQVNKVLMLPNVRKNFETEGVAPVLETPEHFVAFLQSEQNRWRKVIVESKFVKEE